MSKIESGENLMTYYEKRFWAIGGSTEILLWQRKDGRVFRQWDVEGDRRPNGSTIMIGDVIEFLQQLPGNYLNVSYGPAIRVERDSEGRIKSCEFAGKDRLGIWIEISKGEEETWDIKTSKVLIRGDKNEQVA